MRIAIREQLGLLILLASLVSLAIVTIASWVSNHGFVLDMRSQRLSLVASLKAAQLASNLNLMQTTANFVSTRVLIQAALQRYNQGNGSASNWAQSQEDMAAAIGGGGSLGQTLLLQTLVFPKNDNGPNGSSPAFGTTSSTVNSAIRLPYGCPDGSPAYLGMDLDQCDGLGYPPPLYPNFTYTTVDQGGEAVQQAQYDGRTLGPGADSVLMLGPLLVNNSFSLVSLTMPIINNTSDVDVLGWLTAVLDARLIRGVIDSVEGLGDTGEVLLVGPANRTNSFPSGVLFDTNNGSPPENFDVRYVIPLKPSSASAHPEQTILARHEPFPAQDYPALYQAITRGTGTDDNSGANIRAHTEAGDSVSVGYAMAPVPFADWFVLVEQDRSEVWAPINHLRDILLACVFATAAFMAIVAFPLAHFASRPIRRLREATAKSVEPPGMAPSRSSFDSFESIRQEHADEEAGGMREVNGAGGDAALASKEGYTNPLNTVSKYRQKRREEREARREARRKRQFRIPGKVKERKHLVKDELSDLTTTFNEMSDELMMQYSRLEERVQQRTAELEQSKKAAEAANESKTLFIANISHELKTPLNGILGMAAVCMSEDDPVRLKRSLGVIYKSGDLLLNLLTDLLTFSKNQVGQHLSLEEKEFRLRDVSTQILAIFDKQAKDGQIDLRVEWQGVEYLPSESILPNRSELGPNGTGRMKDMILWGDLQRILQVVINLVSNSLKFTPATGSVVLTIRCLPETPDLPNSRKTSMASKQSKQSRQSRQMSSRHKGSDATLPGPKTDTANVINARERPHAMNRERDVSPPPGQYLYFEFEVRDTGPGIPETLHSKIFEPFVQGDLGLSKKYGGTGLGLSICSQLASLMRGTISVQSVEGHGSTFTMKVPLRHLKTRADSSASSSIEAPSRTSSMHRSLSYEDGEKVAARHSRNAADDGKTEVAAPNSPSPIKAAESQPRLVGLSQPFFASTQPMESPGSQPGAMEKIEADATQSGNKIRVLVAEDVSALGSAICELPANDRSEQSQPGSRPTDAEVGRHLRRDRGQGRAGSARSGQGDNDTRHARIPSREAIQSHLHGRPDAQRRRAGEHTLDSRDRLSGAHRRADGLRRGEQHQGLHGVRHEPLPFETHPAAAAQEGAEAVLLADPRGERGGGEGGGATTAAAAVCERARKQYGHRQLDRA